ncbi:MAG: alpha/beta fold hydrolase [Saprospiraceae bacterium]|nr:alpha/beta fold hydrolase [Saprospiraceae bacterium]
MPIVEDISYRPPFWLRNGHLNTIYAGLMRKVETPNYRRSIIRTLDDDFVMIDRLSKGFNRLAVICHGLEGSSQSNYIMSLAPYLHKHGFDILCINFRSCGGVMNRRLQMYHSGDTSDLHMVLKYHQDAYRTIDLIGFSLGGNVILKYLGEDPTKVHHKVNRAVAISVPVDLEAGARRLTEWQNYPYSQLFLRSLKEKVRKKAEKFPDQVDIERLSEVRNVIDFDETYTGPIHGFDGAADYYARSSSLQYLEYIDKPTLLINSKDDPFLSKSCFPISKARDSENLYLYAPQYGGHVGFIPQSGNAAHHEEVSRDFLLSDK